MRAAVTYRKNLKIWPRGQSGPKRHGQWFFQGERPHLLSDNDLQWMPDYV